MSLTRIVLLIGSIVILFFTVDRMGILENREEMQQEISLEEQLTIAATDAMLNTFPVANPEPQIRSDMVGEYFYMSLENLTEKISRYSMNVSELEEGVYGFELEDRISGDTVIAGARCVKRPLYLVVCDEDGRWFYHRENCSEMNREEQEGPVEAYHVVEECAGRGAYPCPVCMP